MSLPIEKRHYIILYIYIELLYTCLMLVNEISHLRSQMRSHFSTRTRNKPSPRHDTLVLPPVPWHRSNNSTDGCSAASRPWRIPKTFAPQRSGTAATSPGRHQRVGVELPPVPDRSGARRGSSGMLGGINDQALLMFKDMN